MAFLADTLMQCCLRVQSSVLYRRTSTLFLGRRWRHTQLKDLRPAQRLRKQSLGRTGALEPIGTYSGNHALRQAIADARDIKGIMQLLVESPSVGTNEVNKAMQRCGDLRDYDALVNVKQLAESKHVPFDEISYNIMITAVARTSRGRDGTSKDEIVKAAALTFGKAAFEEMKLASIPRSVFAYGAVLDLCAKVGDGEWARKIWSEMLLAGLTPTIFNYTQFFLAVLSTGKAGWDDVEQELSRMSAALDAACFTALIDRAGTQYDLDRVEWLWTTLGARVQALSASPFNATAKASILCGVPEKVIPIRQDMMQRGIPIDFRIFLSEIQAILLMLSSEAASERLAQAFWSAVDAAGSFNDNELSKSPGESTISRGEDIQFRSMKQIGEQLIDGKQLPTCDVRVIDWPWPPLSNVAKDTPRQETAETLPHGWQSTLDPNSGCVYFWMQTDPVGTVTWERPT